MGVTIERKRILILVKTKPSISKRYGELICTAGIDEQGNWLRLYPLPIETYKDNALPKYTWIEVDVTTRDRGRDPRPESYVPQLDTLVPHEKVPSDDGWQTRRHLILDRAKIYASMKELRELGRAHQVSLAIFKPKEIISIKVIKEKVAYYTSEEIKRFQQGMASFESDLFRNPRPKLRYRPTEKVPFRLKITFRDIDGTKSCLSVLDWETAALWYNNYKNEPFEVVKDKIEACYWDFAIKRDVYFYLGTLLKFAKMKTKNPWTIIGVAPFHKETTAQIQPEFDFGI